MPGKGMAVRRTRSSLVGVLVTALLFGSATACSRPGADDPQSGTPPTPSASTAPVPGSHGTTTPAPAPDTTGAGQESEESEGVLPTSLVGAWESREDGGAATIAYQFTADGRYKYAGLLFYPNTNGDDVEISFVAEGTARVEGEQLVLTPTTATKSRKDPADPSGDYTDQPAELTSERYRWEVGNNVLTLTDKENTQVGYERQSL